MAYPKFFRDRRGIQYRQCPDCEGAGEVTIGESTAYGVDPETVREVMCANCDGEGDFRVTPVDPLERMAELRREMFDRRNGAMRRRFRDLYDQQRAETMKPSSVPSLHWDDPLFREAKRDCDAALSASSVFMGALSSLTGYGKAA